MIEKIEDFDLSPLLDESDLKADDSAHNAEDPLSLSSETTPRTSKNFKLNMEELLIVAQTPWILDGITAMKDKDFSGKQLNVYSEAVKGIELYIKILERGPDNYGRLSYVINGDPDCSTLKTIIFTLYKEKHSVIPITTKQILEAHVMLCEMIKNSYYKALVNQTMNDIKIYFLISGNLNEVDINSLNLKEAQKLKSNMDKIGNTVTLAIKLVKTENLDMQNGVEINRFIVKASKLLCYYYKISNNKPALEYYQRIHDMHSKYLVLG